MMETQTTEREAFHITDEVGANWYLKKLADIEAEKARITAQTAKMIAELDADANGLKFLYDGELQDFVRTELERKGGRRKTLHLLQGSCAFKNVAQTVRIADATAALTYAKQHNLPCIVVTERVDAEVYKKLAKGELLPGMEKTAEHESFSVKIPKIGEKGQETNEE